MESPSIDFLEQYITELTQVISITEPTLEISIVDEEDPQIVSNFPRISVQLWEETTVRHTSSREVESMSYYTLTGFVKKDSELTELENARRVVKLARTCQAILYKFNSKTMLGETVPQGFIQVEDSCKLLLEQQYMNDVSAFGFNFDVKFINCDTLEVTQ